MVAISILVTFFAACILITLSLPNTLENGMLVLEAAWNLENQVDQILHESIHNFGMATSTRTADINGTTTISIDNTADALLHSIEATTTWTTITGHQQSFAIQGLVSNFSGLHENSSCGTSSATDWLKSNVVTRSVTSSDLLTQPINGTTHPISNVVVSSTTMVLTVINAYSANDPSLFLFDIRDPHHPVFESAIDTSPSTKLGTAAAAINGNYVYTASAVQPNYTSCLQNTSCAQLQIVTIHDPFHPTLVSNLKLPTNTAPYAIGISGQSAGKAVAYANGYVYLGLTKTGSTNGEEFNIINVQSPEVPLWVGGFQIGRTVTGIIIRGIYAYVTTDDPDQGLIILNIHDPLHVTQIARYHLPNTSIYTYPQTLELASTSLFIGRTYSPNQPEFLAVDVSSITTPSLRTSAEIAAASNPWNVDGVVLAGPTAFVARDTGLDVLDISDPNKIQIRETIPLPPNATTTALACIGNTLYVTSITAADDGLVTSITHP